MCWGFFSPYGNVFHLKLFAAESKSNILFAVSSSCKLTGPLSKPSSFLMDIILCEKFHEMIDDLILSSADTQLLLILAYGVAFYSTAQCQMSLYHYFVALHTILVGLSTSLLASVLVHSRDKSYFTSCLRIIICSVAFIGLYNTNGIHISNKSQGKVFLGRLPARTQEDSLLLLPAYCVLEETVSPFFHLNVEQQQLFTNSGGPCDVSRQCLVLLFIHIIMSLFTILDINPRRILQSQKRARQWVYISGVCRGLIWIGCLALIIFNWVSIETLRSWVDGSEWLSRDEGRNPEKDYQGIGQLAPLFSLGAIGFTLLNTFWEIAKEPCPMFERLSHNNNDNNDGNGNQLQPDVNRLLASQGGYSQI